MKKLVSFAFIVGSVLLLSACISQPTYLSTDPAYSTYTHVVQQGETISLIAQRYGTTVASITEINRLGKPYRVYSGQRLQINVPNAVNQKSPSASQTRMRQIRRTPRSTNVTPPASNQVKRCYPPVKWQHPTTTRQILKTPSYTGKGIAAFLFGRYGQAVRAAASGKVVYSGRSPNGYYPNLIIIQHNKTFLSTYAYNQKRLVKVGERVIAGQKIAEMGVNPKNQATLYFEIRCHGKAVDPLAYLPK